MAQQGINNRKDILLLLLYSPGRSGRTCELISGRTRLVKMLFLFRHEALNHFRKGTEITEENFYDFFPWDFGPFSPQAYDDLVFFILRGFVETSDSDDPALPESAEEWEHWLDSGAEEWDSGETIIEYTEEQFALTQEGRLWVETHLWPLLSRAQKQLLQEFKARLVRAPLRAILRYVYDKYPSMVRVSKIRERILGEYLG